MITEQCNDLQEKVTIIIHRLIDKTHQNIRLHQRLDFLVENLFLLYTTDRTYSKIYFNYSRDYFQWKNRLKSSIAELRVLKMEVRFYEDMLIKMKMTLKKCSSSLSSSSSSFNNRRENRKQIVCCLTDC